MNIINLSVPAGVSSPVAECGAVMIGYVGEGGVTQAVLDFSAWAQAYGEGVVTLGVQRSGDPTWYPVALTVDGTTAAWLVSKTDTAVEGMGVARFAYTVGGAEKRSAVWQFFVDRGLQSPEGDAPDPYESWVETLTGLGAETLQNAQDAREAAEDAAGSAESAETAKNAAGDAAAAAGESARAAGENASTAAGAAQDAQNAAGAAEQSATDAEAAQQAAETAVTHYPKIVNDFWWVWDAERGEYVNTGVKAKGEDGEGAVLSVNGKTGVVTLDAEDVGALPNSSTLDNIPDGATYKRPTAAQLRQIQTNAADIQTQGGDIDQLQADVDAIEQKIPNQASSTNQLADKEFVNSSINSAAAFFRGAFPTRAALFEVAWQTTDPQAANYVSNNDYAYVADDETHNDEAWRYIYVLQPGGTGNGWQPQFRVNESPLTAAQIAALNSGATAALIEQISTNAAAIARKQAVINASGILKGAGNGQVSAAVAGRDYLAPSALTPYRTATAQDVIDEAQDAAIAGKYTKPGTGIPENDLASDAQSKIDNALPKTGDGSNVTAAFTAAANRTNISTGEKLSVIFGKIAKWFSDLGSAAFRAATGSITQGSTDLVESGAVYNGLSGKYTKPAGGIPATDMAKAVQTSLAKADTALQEHQSLAAYRTAAAQDVIDAAQSSAIAGKVANVQLNGVSIVDANHVATVPVISDYNQIGAVKIGGIDNGLAVINGVACVAGAIDSLIKSGSANTRRTISPGNQHKAVFYGLAKAAGDSTQAASSNAVGNYTETAKSKISEMLNGSVTVTGTTPTITAQPGVRYVCGEVTTLDITLPASGIVDATFESGSTATVLTITPPSGVTVRWANGFDPTALEANTTYEINIADGLGVAAQWT